MQSTRIKIASVAAATAALVGVGGAIAADRLSSKQESNTIVADAAKQLGVTAAKLDAALKQALANRVDAAVTAGQITKARGDDLKARIAAGEVPLVGVGHGGRGHGTKGVGHHLGGLDAAAAYLGVTEAALRTSLRGGSTLAEIAKERSKSVDGLKDALEAAAKADISQAVQDGKLTAAQQTEILAGLSDRIDGLVNGELGARGGHGPRGEHGPRGFGMHPAGDA